MDNKKASNPVGMITNQQAYNTDGDSDGRYTGGADRIELYENADSNANPTNPENKYINFKNENDKLSNGQSKTLIRTDIDTHDGYNVPKLQNQEKGSNDVGYEGSSLNIASYNVYDKDGLQIEKIERFV